ncbi:hypothetical protein LBMAG38_17270 [Chloroflexota bacterium]|nr:hypothetical protein LBMAG38_17270 [Chloroflexota bacterium]
MREDILRDPIGIGKHDTCTCEAQVSDDDGVRGRDLGGVARQKSNYT